MPMTVVVTRNLPGRFRGFLASCMCEIAPGIYTAPRMTQAVRERVWGVVEEWFQPFAEAAIVMTWPDTTIPGGQRVLTLGTPRKELCNHHGVFLVRSPLSAEEERSLTTESFVAQEDSAPESA